jgi:O-antigen ligase
VSAPSSRASARIAPVELALALAFALASSIALGIFAARAPAWTLFGAGALAGVLAARIWPLAFVAAFAVIEPLQGMLVFDLPREARYFDEAVMLGVAATVLLPKLLSRPASLLSDRPLKLILAFTIWNLVSAALSSVPLSIAAMGIFVTIDYMIMFATLRAMPFDERAARLVMKIVIAIGLIATVVGALQHLGVESASFAWAKFIREDVLRVPSLFEHPNDFGLFMLSATFLSLSYLIANKRSKLYVLATVVSVAGVIISFSRTSYVALVAGLVVGLWMHGGQVIKKALIPGAVVIVLLGGVTLRAVMSRVHKIEAEGGDARFTYFRQSLPLIEDNPFFGVGPGRYGGEIAQRTRSPVHEQYGVTFNDTWRTLDSFWLHIVAESGIVGGLLLLGIFFSVSARSKKRLSAVTDPHLRALLAAAPMIVTALVAADASTMALEANTHAGLLWTMLGVGLSAARDRI